MRNIKLIIEYDGTNYHGWQSQKNAIAVQNVLESAIQKLTGEKNRLIGSSRTDEGVHALGMVANFATDSRIPADKFPFALNSILPDDIVIKFSEEAAPDFHARFSAKGKKYRYLIYNSRQPSALLRDRAYFVPQILNFDAMKSASAFFLGKHDFSAFKAVGSSVKTSERTITHISLDKHETGNGSLSGQGTVLCPINENGQRTVPCPEMKLIELNIAGDGFLYNMVRIIAGTLVEVGMCKINADAIPDILESCDRKRAGRTAPPHGLYLVEVYY